MTCSSCDSPDVVTVPGEFVYCLGCYEDWIAFMLARKGGRYSHKEKQK